MAKQWTWNTSSKAWPCGAWDFTYTCLYYPVRPHLFIPAPHSELFCETRLGNGWGTVRPYALWFWGGFITQTEGWEGGGSTHLQPSHLSLPREAECDKQCFPAASAQGLQNHRRITNATPLWQLALLWKGEEGHLWHGRSHTWWNIPHKPDDQRADSEASVECRTETSGDLRPQPKKAHSPCNYTRSLMAGKEISLSKHNRNSCNGCLRFAFMLDLSEPHALYEHFPPTFTNFMFSNWVTICYSWEVRLLPTMLLSILYIADFSLYALLLSRQTLLEEEQLWSSSNSNSEVNRGFINMHVIFLCVIHHGFMQLFDWNNICKGVNANHSGTSPNGRGQ